MSQNIIGVKISNTLFGLQPTLDKNIVIYLRGNTLPCKISQNLLNKKWNGGEFVKFVDDPSSSPTIDIADGRWSAFLIYGSNDAQFKHTATEESNLTYGTTVVMYGNCFAYTLAFEKLGYLARHGLGPIVSLQYKPNDKLYVSENGLITIEDESDTALFPIHTYPNGDPITDRFQSFGYCAVAPKNNTSLYLAFSATM
jgi:hypothetical protein